MAADGRYTRQADDPSGRGPQRPCPVSRQARGFGLVDLAREIDHADQILSTRMGAQLQLWGPYSATGFDPGRP